MPLNIGNLDDLIKNKNVLGEWVLGNNYMNVVLGKYQDVSVV